MSFKFPKIVQVLTSHDESTTPHDLCRWQMPMKFIMAGSSSRSTREVKNFSSLVPRHSGPIAIIDNLLAPLAEFQKLLDRPKLKRVAGWCVRVLKWCPVEDMISTFLVHVVGVLFSVMPGDPFVDLFKDRVGVLGRSVPVRVVEVLPVPETHLLSAGYTFEPARTVSNVKADGLYEAYLSLFWILRAKGALSFPLI